eukprot:188708_1
MSMWFIACLLLAIANCAFLQKDTLEHTNTDVLVLDNTRLTNMNDDTDRIRAAITGATHIQNIHWPTLVAIAKGISPHRIIIDAYSNSQSPNGWRAHILNNDATLDRELKFRLNDKTDLWASKDAWLGPPDGFFAALSYHRRWDDKLKLEYLGSVVLTSKSLQYYFVAVKAPTDVTVYGNLDETAMRTIALSVKDMSRETTVDGKFYLSNNHFETRDKAKAFCKKNSMSLFVAGTKKDVVSLKTITQSNARTYYIGYQFDASEGDPTNPEIKHYSKQGLFTPLITLKDHVDSADKEMFDVKNYLNQNLGTKARMKNWHATAKYDATTSDVVIDWVETDEVQTTDTYVICQKCSHPEGCCKSRTQALATSDTHTCQAHDTYDLCIAAGTNCIWHCDEKTRLTTLESRAKFVGISSFVTPLGPTFIDEAGCIDEVADANSKEKELSFETCDECGIMYEYEYDTTYVQSTKIKQYFAETNSDSHGFKQLNSKLVRGDDIIMTVDQPKRTLVRPTKEVYKYIGVIFNGCTATLIGPRHAITAAHCVFTGGPDGNYRAIGLNSFDPAFLPGLRLPISLVIIPSNWRKLPFWDSGSGEKTHDDMALIILRDYDHPYIDWKWNTIKFGHLSFGFYNYHHEYMKFQTAGYPHKEKQPTKSMWTYTFTSEVKCGHYYQSLSNYHGGGQSGSSIWKTGTDGTSPICGVSSGNHPKSASDSNGNTFDIFWTRLDNILFLMWCNIIDNTHSTEQSQKVCTGRNAGLISQKHHSIHDNNNHHHQHRVIDNHATKDINDYNNDHYIYTFNNNDNYNYYNQTKWIYLIQVLM